MSTITVSMEYTVRPATGPNPASQPLELIDPDGDRYGYVDSNDDAVMLVRMLMDDVAMFTFDINLDGVTQ